MISGGGAAPAGIIGFAGPDARLQTQMKLWFEEAGRSQVGE
jgi:hypothetical protein